MSAMFFAKHSNHRTIWMSGAGLMGVVIVKLFLVELAKSGSVERIISFIVVGLLLLFIGYFAALPPARSEKNGAL